jgi:hypothetical protein
VEHYEKMKISERSDVELFVKAWPKVPWNSRIHSRITKWIVGTKQSKLIISNARHDFLHYTQTEQLGTDTEKRTT